ncbi:zinc-binding dehydrogenase [Thermoflexus sp.]|uniref:zinc-binding dehydrogenase n=1 Tax=Thermoflexus sp. TaxID=1969742 RepID=UPI0025FF3C25|nr:zinc-binding dehydrogenase [Thermoflexus sp.]MCS6963662.1 zinc-binding dehydrogenase [Thermoflexus sp.]MDW8184586.1 zinc-binding dehydrogenase [Anaerolineae bacterium]
MKAIVFYRHGDPDVLEAAELPTPHPGPGEVLVRVRACAMNHLDLWVRRGIPSLRLEMPHILGSDVAGVVAEVGPEISGIEVGDRVVVNATLSCGQCEFCLRGEDNRCRQGGILGEHVRGGYAEYVVVPARNLLKLPEGFPFEEAAAASLVFLTAWHMLITRGALRPGEDVLIVGAGGGVNTAALQIAKLAGARVIVVASNPEKAERARALGADHVIDRSQEPDWSRAAWQWTGRRGVDVVVDNVGRATWMKSIRVLRPGGRMLVVGATSGPNPEDFDIRYVFSRQISILGSTMGTQHDFRTVMGLIFAGRLRPVIDRVLPLTPAGAREGHRLLESGAVFGKIVFQVDAIE